MNNTENLSTKTLHRPVRFQGTLAQADENSLTHLFTWADEDTRCMNCDCRPAHAAASYPCGTEPARETVVSYFNEDGEVVGQEITADRPKVDGYTIAQSYVAPVEG